MQDKFEINKNYYFNNSSEVCYIKNKVRRKIIYYLQFYL